MSSFKEQLKEIFEEYNKKMYALFLKEMEGLDVDIQKLKKRVDVLEGKM